MPAVKKLGSPPPRGNGVSVGPLDDEVRGPTVTDGKMTCVGIGLKVKPHHVDADGVIPDDTQLHVMNLTPVLDYRAFASALRDIA